MSNDQISRFETLLSREGIRRGMLPIIVPKSQGKSIRMFDVGREAAPSSIFAERKC